MPHAFMCAADIVVENKKINSYLGTEFDFTAGFNFKKDIIFTGGYSQMFGTKTLEVLKTPGYAGHANNWAWLMISVNPRVFTWKK